MTSSAIHALPATIHSVAQASNAKRRKDTGAYYTPTNAAEMLVRWAARSETDRLLDPSCGDGRFLSFHRNSFGVEQDLAAHREARQRAPWARIHHDDFFAWASTTTERFDCAAGNPPFIRYQRFSGSVRQRALSLCERLGVRFSALTSSWAPFLAATASLLKAGGRMAFVVPAEIGHASYAEPLLEYLAASFERVQIIALRKKLFSELSEDVWLLFAEGYGGRSRGFHLHVVNELRYEAAPPRQNLRISLAEWEQWKRRLRPFLLPPATREFYRDLADKQNGSNLGEVARTGIGYVTGANDFFHLTPSAAERLKIPTNVLRPAVRNGRMLTGESITASTVKGWIEQDLPVLLLNLGPDAQLNGPLRRYLDSEAGRAASESYKCRNRSPWYSVPDVKTPNAFLPIMSSKTPNLVLNQAKCAATNSVLGVTVRGSWPLAQLVQAWNSPVTALSCEIEGHPLGGGVLKLEPGEANQVRLVPPRRWLRSERDLIADGVDILQQWRHSSGEETEAL